MRRLSLTTRAAADLDSLNYHGTKQYGPERAATYYSALNKAIRALLEWPNAYRERDEIQPPVRLMRYNAHHVLFRVTEDEIIILRILHHSANWLDLL